MKQASDVLRLFSHILSLSHMRPKSSLEQYLVKSLFPCVQPCRSKLCAARRSLSATQDPKLNCTGNKRKGCTGPIVPIRWARLVIHVHRLLLFPVRFRASDLGSWRATAAQGSRVYFFNGCTHERGMDVIAMTCATCATTSFVGCRRFPQLECGD